MFATDLAERVIRTLEQVQYAVAPWPDHSSIIIHAAGHASANPAEGALRLTLPNTTETTRRESSLGFKAASGT